MKNLKTEISHLRMTEKTETIVKEYSDGDMRSMQNEINYFICLGIHARKIIDGEIARNKKFNAQDYS